MKTTTSFSSNSASRPPHSSQSQSFIRTRTPGLLHAWSEQKNENQIIWLNMNSEKEETFFFWNLYLAAFWDIPNAYPSAAAPSPLPAALCCQWPSKFLCAGLFLCTNLLPSTMLMARSLNEQMHIACLGLSLGSQLITGYDRQVALITPLWVVASANF